MKFKLEALAQGVVVCHILAPLTKPEALQIVQGMEKFLGNGKARIIVEFNNKSAAGEGGADFLEKSLRPVKVLAKKMRGDLLFVVPDSSGGAVMGALKDLNTALQTLLGPSSDAGKSGEEILKELETAKKTIVTLTTENEFLTTRVKELIDAARKPSTDEELKKAVDHYRKLAAEVEKNPTEGAKPAAGAAATAK